MKYSLLAAIAACSLGLAGAAHAQGGGGVPGDVQTPDTKLVNPAYPQSPKLRKELHEPPPPHAIHRPHHRPRTHWPFHAPKPGAPAAVPPAEPLGGGGGH